MSIIHIIKKFILMKNFNHFGLSNTFINEGLKPLTFTTIHCAQVRDADVHIVLLFNTCQILHLHIHLCFACYVSLCVIRFKLQYECVCDFVCFFLYFPSLCYIIIILLFITLCYLFLYIIYFSYLFSNPC